MVDSKYRLNRVSTKLCQHCLNETENVAHFSLDCDLFKTYREKLFRTVSLENTGFAHMSRHDKLRFILNMDCNDNLQGACCKYVSVIYGIRESL